jgi:AraC-like DNA-binding protein
MSATFDWTNIEEVSGPLFDANEPQSMHLGKGGASWAFAVGREAGEGSVEFYRLSSKANILIMDCTFREEREILVNDGSGVRLNFALTLDVLMQPDGRQPTHAATQSWRVINSVNQSDMLEKFAAGTRHCWMTVHSEPEWLASLIGQSVADLPELLQPLPEFINRQPVNSAFSNRPQLTGAVSDILNCELQGDLRISYMSARAQEMACLALHLLLEPAADVPSINLTARDRSAIEQIGIQLREQYRSPPSVEQLARGAGMNRNKLYYGFREIFGVSISKFIQSIRLEQAHNLLTTTDIALIDLADMTGFSHQSNFSTAVRNRYGRTPRAIRADAAANHRKQ